MILASLAVAGGLLLGALVTTPGAPTECRDADGAMLALPLEAFDQGDSGWRSLDQPGCELVTAEVIRQYRQAHGAGVADWGDTVLWHEAQLRAAGGDTEEAIRLMVISRAKDSLEIRPYTDATIAFLRRDREALLAARAELVALPMPEQFARASARYAERYPDLPPLEWPLNLHVVDGLIACFDKPYREAYGCDPAP
jgi:hypothetical protein